MLLLGIFIILHGLVHIWYVVLSLELVEFQPVMGWTGRSWIFTDRLGDEITRKTAAIQYGLAALLFVVAGIMTIFQLGQAEKWTAIAAIISTATIVEFWDGKPQLLVQKGLLGIAVNIGLIVYVT